MTKRNLSGARLAGHTVGHTAQRRRLLEDHNVVGVQIRGQLWAQPVPLELLVRTEIDLETGKVEIADLANTRAV